MKHFHPPGRSKGPTAVSVPLRIPGCCRGRWRRFGHREQLRKRAWDPICFLVPISCKKIRLHFVGILFFSCEFYPRPKQASHWSAAAQFSKPRRKNECNVLFFVELLQCRFGLRRFGVTCLVASGMIFSSGMQSLSSGRPSELDGTQFYFQVWSVFGDFKLTRWAGLQLLEST